jgi:hypothetical protein
MGANGTERTENLVRRMPSPARTTQHWGSKRMSGITPARRVRHDVRDGLMVMAFSLVMSCVMALLLTSIVHLGN